MQNLPRHVRRWGLCALTCWLCGCVPVPIPQTANEADLTLTGDALGRPPPDRQRVLEVLGTPLAETARGDWLYVVRNPGLTMWYVDVATPFLLAFAGAFATDLESTNLTFKVDHERFSWLMLSFQQGEVISAEYHDHLGAGDYCFATGVCLAADTGHLPVEPTALDTAAKRFEPVPGRCVVYFYRQRAFGDKYFDVLVNNRRRASSVEGGYSRWELDPRRYLSVRLEGFEGPDGQDLAVTEPNDVERVIEPLITPCGAGEVIYVRAEDSLFRRPSLALVEPATAQPAIRQRRLLVDRYLAAD